MEVSGMLDSPRFSSRTGYGVVAGGIQRDAVGRGLFIAEMQSAQIAVREVAKRGMLEHVWSRFHSSTTQSKLLPPASPRR